MAKVNVGIPQGTRDFGPEVVRKRNYIFNTIRNVFELYGFQPLETPAMENLETLMGKYGEEGDKLIFRILDSGNSFQKDFFIGLFRYVLDFRNEIVQANPNISGFKSFEFLETIIDHPTLIPSLARHLQEDENLNKKYLSKFKNEISSKALRYDLTIPFARYVAMNHGQLTYPFKRYQIQPVWRADRPQKGRYREFYQCDADVVGSNSLLNEVELITIYSEVFSRLEINKFDLRINNRKILVALAELCGGLDKLVDITTAIDKLDKIGLAAVELELSKRGLSNNQIDNIRRLVNVNRFYYSNEPILYELKLLFSKSPLGMQGIQDIEFILNFITNPDVKKNVFIDVTLARGLNYYTGTILEVTVRDVKIGSIGGGGRYDDLTGLFGVPNIPGVGISFGVDRIYDVMEELKLFPADVYTGTQVLFFNLGEKENKVVFETAQRLRDKNIRCEIYHEPAKFDKQFKYAEKKNIPFIVIIGEEEIKTGSCKIKNIITGEQTEISLKDIPEFPFKHS
jgi:histidyl-tRNA synthetase